MRAVQRSRARLRLRLRLFRDGAVSRGERRRGGLREGCVRKRMLVRVGGLALALVLLVAEFESAPDGGHDRRGGVRVAGTLEHVAPAAQTRGGATGGVGAVRKIRNVCRGVRLRIAGCSEADSREVVNQKCGVTIVSRLTETKRGGSDYQVEFLLVDRKRRTSR